MKNAIILAGGKGSRLGPLATQISKALVSIGQRPHLAHQIETLRRCGFTNIVVVTSPDTDTQVSHMLYRAGLDVPTVVQTSALGPVDAIRVGLLHENISRDESTITLASDTYIDQRIPQTNVNWVGSAPAPSERVFCVWRGTDYQDTVAAQGEFVTMGMYHFQDTEKLLTTATALLWKYSDETEITMAPLLNRYGMTDQDEVAFHSWLDIGDVKALANARKRKFISREHHSLRLEDDGTLIKTGEGHAFNKQAAWMAEMSSDYDYTTANLVPRVYSVGANSYCMEYVDLPTLSELYLYWPGRPDVWRDIIEGVVSRLAASLWKDHGVASVSEHDMFIKKTRDRIGVADEETHKMINAVEHLFSTDPETTLNVHAHGDLTFNNILYSLNSGMIKLVDPRGERYLPLLYELAKLRYSYHGGLAAIMHNLIDEHGRILPQRYEENEAMDTVLFQFDKETRILAGEGLLFLAGAPMHDERQALAMTLQGKELLRQAKMRTQWEE